MSEENYRNLSLQLADFRKDVDKRLDGMDKRLDGMDKRLDGMDKRLDGMDRRLDGMDRRLDVMEGKMLPAKWMIASVLVPLGAVALAFIGACAVVIFGS